MALLLRCECAYCVSRGDTRHIPGVPIEDAVGRDVLDVIAGERAVINQAIAGAVEDLQEAADAMDGVATRAAANRLVMLILEHSALDAKILARLGGPIVSPLARRFL